MLDFVAGAGLALLSLLVTLASPSARTIGYALLLRLLLAAAIFLSVGLRRRRPVPAYGVLLVTATLSHDSLQPASILAMLASAYVLYTVANASSRRTGAAALVLGLVTTVALTVFGTGFPAHRAVFLPAAFELVISWMIGYATRQRRLYADMLREQAASSAVAEERLRIARELHDVVAHSMSVIAVQAGFGQYVIDSSPSGAREALGAIQSTSRDALDEMRRMLGVLRQQDTAASGTPALAPLAPLAPEPGIDGLDRLIERTSGTGVRVCLQHFGTPRELPAGIGLSAYRIVQEALTNVVKHAGGDARCVVHIRYTDEALGIDVTDDGGAGPATADGTPAARLTPGAAAVAGAPVITGTGHGIIGMRERVHLCGGEFSAGPLPDGGFTVTATLPLRPAHAQPGGRA